MQAVGVRERVVRQRVVRQRLALAATVVALALLVSGCSGAAAGPDGESGLVIVPDNGGSGASGGDANGASGTDRSPVGSTVPPTGNRNIDRQLAYAMKHWDDTSSKKYGNLGGTDCVNFTSQTLLARGWTMDADWWYSKSNGSLDYASPWISSTAFMRYLQGRPDLATALTDNQRSKVRVGDIAQFDYDNSGDRDHTGVVSRVTNSGGHISIDLVQHSKGDDFRSVDGMLKSHEAGAKVHYWHLST